jgi:hypothetical protein
MSTNSSARTEGWSERVATRLRVLMQHDAYVVVMAVVAAALWVGSSIR